MCNQILNCSEEVGIFFLFEFQKTKFIVTVALYANHFLLLKILIGFLSLFAFFSLKNIYSRDCFFVVLKKYQQKKNKKNNNI